MASGRQQSSNANSSSSSNSNNLDGFSLGRNVTITPAGKRGASSALEELAGYSGVGANGSRQQSVTYPKNPISITAVPVGSPTRASPKGGQARQPPPALIPVGGGTELLDNFVTNGVDLLAHLRLIENKIIYCVNKTPYRNTEYLMTIFDLKDVFFPYISLDVCRRVLNALDISLFVGNSLQYQALQEAGRTNVDKMPMIQVTDVMTYMPQLQYMIRSSNLNQETQANKRARIS
uniref:Uncharacterized protein n=1 Tax=Anopheles maculatus TaxID=74869 RepID=A0A182SNL6_9DIPT